MKTVAPPGIRVRSLIFVVLKTDWSYMSGKAWPIAPSNQLCYHSSLVRKKGRP
jgi:hypothetical protein